MVANRRMLLADDSMTIQKIVQLTFADEGVEVCVVSNGEQAIEELQKNNFDIVLTDVFVSGRSGYEVCEYIKSSNRLRHIPVLLLIGTFEFYDAVEARRVGAEDVLTKPFKSIKEMVNKVSTMLGSRTEENTTEETPLSEQPIEPSLKQNDKVLPHVAPVDVSTKTTAELTVASTIDAEEDEATVATKEKEPELPDILIQTQPTAPLVSPSAAPVFETAESFDTMLHDTQAFDQVDDAQPTSIVKQESRSTVNANLMNANTIDDLVDNSSTNNQTGQLPTLSFDTPATNDAPLQFGAIDSHQTSRLDVPPAMPAAAADDFVLDLDDDDLGSAPSSSDEAFAPSFNSNVALSEQDSMILDLDDLPMGNQPPPVATRSSGESGNTVGFPQAPELLQGVPTVIESNLQQPPQYSGIVNHTQQIGLEQLTPEAIDAIARRVVEHLSDKVVREIAWEVVPQLSERLIKRRLEEENSRTR